MGFSAVGMQTLHDMLSGGGQTRLTKRPTAGSQWPCDAGTLRGILYHTLDGCAALGGPFPSRPARAGGSSGDQT